MDLKQFEGRIKWYGMVVSQEVPKYLSLRAGVDMISNIQRRVIGSGRKASGEPFSPYSTRPMFIGSKSFTHKTHANKVFGSKSKRAKLEWRTIQGRRLAILPGGYKQIREIEGRETKHKSFERTGTMWRSIRIVDTAIEGNGIYSVTIGSRDPDQERLLSYHNERENDNLLRVSLAEKQLIGKQFQKYITNLLQKNITGL